MKCCWRQTAQRLRERFGADGAGFEDGAPADLLGEKRGTGDGGGAATAEKSRFRDLAIDDSRGEFQDVTADGIVDFHYGSCARNLSGVARAAEVIEDGFAEHP